MTTNKKKKTEARPIPSEATTRRSEVDRRLRQADRLARVIRVLQLLLTRDGGTPGILPPTKKSRNEPSIAT